MDIDRWLIDHTAPQPPDQTANLTWYVSVPYLYGEYGRHCTAHGAMPMGKSEFISWVTQSLPTKFHRHPRPRFTGIRFFRLGVASGTLTFGD